MLYLCIAIVAFFAGVFVHPVLHGKTRILALIDAVIVLAVLALVSLFMLPHTLEESGMIGLLGIAVGFSLTFGLDKLSVVSQTSARPWATTLLVLVLVAHAIFDGAALALPEHHHGSASISVAAGVLLHRLPMGMIVHHLLGPNLKIPLIVAAFVSLSTVFGYAYADESFTEGNKQIVHLLECLVVGMLIQVVFSHLGSLKSLTQNKG